jgi:hypothetical protein
MIIARDLHKTRDKVLNAEQVSDFRKDMASVIAAATACYMARIPRLKVLLAST